MAHVRPNFKTKKDFKQAVKDGIEIRPFNPSGMFPTVENGQEFIEGPWEMHKWYARVQVVNGVITKVLS